MTLAVTACFVQVDDPDTALAFYRDALGLELRNDVANGPYRWLTVGSPSQPGVSIVISNFVNGSPDDVDAVAALLAKGAFNAVHLSSDDLDATFAQVKGAGAEIVSEITDQPWGVRDFAVRDSAGNLVRIEQA